MTQTHEDLNTTPPPGGEQQPWYKEVTPYMWVVLAIASMGWLFDVFESQIFVASMQEAIPSLEPNATAEAIRLFNNIALGAFLLGGAMGGVGFGMLSDRIGRVRTLTITILFYALFAGLSAFTQSWWQFVVLRFLVGLGTGGEWAVGTALVAEVVTERARSRLLGVFHASSVFGTYLAVAAGLFILANPDLGFPWANWRLGFAVGVVPALLVVAVRLMVREPQGWMQAKQRAKEDTSQGTGKLGDIFSRDRIRVTIIGIGLATVGLSTFWGVYIYGKNLMRNAAERSYAQQLPAYLIKEGGERPVEPLLKEEIDMQKVMSLGPAGLNDFERLAELAANVELLDGEAEPIPPEAGFKETRAAIQERLQHNYGVVKFWEMIGLLLVATGGGVGLLCFGPISERIGRRGAFVFFCVGGLAATLIFFQVMPEAGLITYLWTLPIFGFLTLGMHAGFAIYFPELYPSRLRSTGAGVCFNSGRILAAPVLFIFGYLQLSGVALQQAITWLSFLYLVGLVLVWFAPETQGRELPE